MLTESKDDSPEWKLLQGGHQLDGNIIESLKEKHAQGLNHEGLVRINQGLIVKTKQKKNSSPVIRISSYIQNTSH